MPIFVSNRNIVIKCVHVPFKIRILSRFLKLFTRLADLVLLVRECHTVAVLLLNVCCLVFVRMYLMYNLCSECLVVDDTVGNSKFACCLYRLIFVIFNGTILCELVRAALVFS